MQFKHKLLLRPLNERLSNTMLPFLATLSAPITSIIGSVIDSFKHGKEMKELTRQKELEIEKTKVEMAKEANSAESLIALENLKQPLGDRGFRRFLIVCMALPLVGLLPDVFGFPNFGSAKVIEYMTLVRKTIPEEYLIFILTMVGSYFGIPKVKEVFFNKK